MQYIIVYIRRPHQGQQAVRVPSAFPPLSPQPGIQVVLRAYPHPHRNIKWPASRGQGSAALGLDCFCLPKRPLRDNVWVGVLIAYTLDNVIFTKAKYMTLGPKFFCCSKMAVTRRRKHLFQ